MNIPDMDKVDRQITIALKSDVALINKLSSYIINSGGKRLRPKLTILSALSCGYQGDNHIKLATIIEFIHTATLLHDDVVDESDLRRGKETANSVFGNQVAILTGDFLYSRAFQMMSEVANLRVMATLSDTTNIIAEGEVLQLLNIGEVDISEDDYSLVIYRKTAKLFETACLLGAIISEQDELVCNALSDYGKHLGNAFQMIDDVMDYLSDSKTMGKNIGDDLSEGKVTLPLIYALKQANNEQKSIIKSAILEPDVGNIQPIIEILQKTSAIDYTIKKAKAELNLAIQGVNILPDSAYKQVLVNIAEQSLHRVF